MPDGLAMRRECVVLHFPLGWVRECEGYSWSLNASLALWDLNGGSEGACG